MSYQVNDFVYAKWPGSGGKYFKAKITNVFEEDEIYEVSFLDTDDDTLMNIEFHNIMSVDEAEKFTRSGRKRRSRSRSRSPARTRSPARKKSPGRSPGRLKGHPRALISSVTSSSSNEDTPQSTMVKQETKVTRRSTRIAQHETRKTTISSSTSSGETTTTTYKKTTSPTHSMPKMPNTPGYNGLVSLCYVMIIITLKEFVLYPLYLCTKDHCSFVYKPKDFWARVPKSYQAYFNNEAFLALNCFLLFTLVLHSLPIGDVKIFTTTTSKKEISYRFNGFAYGVVTVFVYCASIFYEVPVASFIQENLFKLAATLLAEASLFSIIAYFLSFWSNDEINPRAQTGSIFRDLFNGRILNGRLGKMIDLKYLSLVLYSTLVVLLNIVVLQSELNATKTFRPVLLFVAGTQIISAVLPCLPNEQSFVTGPTIKYHGIGFWVLYLPSTAILYTMQSRYILNHPNLTKLTDGQMVMVISLYILGQSISYFSQLQKWRFRMNPYDPNLAGLESIAPSRSGGERLLTSGFWGFVRKPNYLGEIMMVAAWCLACGCQHHMVWAPFVFTVATLLYKIMLDEAGCYEKHGYAYKEYVRRVPYRLIPRIF